jgi:hypothetical protein
MKIYFTAEEMHTPEYAEYVKWMSNIWRLNDERNKRFQMLPNGQSYQEYCAELRARNRKPLSWEACWELDGDEE